MDPDPERMAARCTHHWTNIGMMTWTKWNRTSVEGASRAVVMGCANEVPGVRLGDVFLVGRRSMRSVTIGLADGSPRPARVRHLRRGLEQVSDSRDAGAGDLELAGQISPRSALSRLQHASPFRGDVIGLQYRLEVRASVPGGSVRSKW